ncbi:MAG: hypothetical protein ACPGVA_09855 [Pikeienuella sp.]
MIWRDPFTYISLIALAVMLSAPGGARQMRGFDPIPTPERAQADLPEGAEMVQEIANVPRDEVADAARELASAWNGPGLADKISDSKFDKARFERAMITEVPRDARLEVESLRSVATLAQGIVPDGAGGLNRVSTVAATMSTRLTINDPTLGFVSAPGVNEIRFQVTEPLR